MVGIGFGRLPCRLVAFHWPQLLGVLGFHGRSKPEDGHTFPFAGSEPAGSRGFGAGTCGASPKRIIVESLFYG